MDNFYRELTGAEVIQAQKQKEIRTSYEREAYRLLPNSIKAKVERNPPIAFKDCNVTFFPDLFFREERICVEIDGGYHYKRIRQDTYRDEVFAMHDFINIRIKNLDTLVNVSFWQRLVEGLSKIENRTPSIDVIITELLQMIETEIKSWTMIS